MRNPSSSVKFLAVTTTGLIHDPKVSGPCFRLEVIAKPPNFEHRDPVSQKLIKHHTNHAVRWISQFPSLQLKFAEIAYRRMDFLESSLWLEDSLPTSLQNQFKLELSQLQNNAFPIWQNAITSTRQYVGHLIKSTIHEWMHEPINFSEKSLFISDWENFPYSCDAATKYFQKIDSRILDTLRIQLEDYTHIETQNNFKFYKLCQSIQDANQQVQQLNLNLVFEEF